MNHKSVAYMNGVKDFVELASNFVDNSGKVWCLWKKCVNMSFERIGVIQVHFLLNGFHKFYTEWIFHGEKIQNLINKESQVDENVDEIRDI